MPWSFNRAAALLVIAALTALVLFAPVPSGAHWAIVLGDSAHGPVSALIAAIVFQQLSLLSRRRRVPRWPVCRWPVWQWTLAIATTTILGILIEFVQSLIGRDAEVMDVITDLLGALVGAGLSVFLASDAPGGSRTLRRAGLASAMIAGAFIVAPVATMAAAYVARNTRFPVLMDGSAPLGATFLTTFWATATQETLPPQAQPAFPGEKSLKVQIDGQRVWSTALLEVRPDWRSWNTLVVELFNPGDYDVYLRLRVFDRPDGLAVDKGFITRQTLAPRSRTLWKIPLHEMATAAGTQRLDLSHIHGLILFPAHDSRNSPLFLLNMRLE